MNVQERAIEVVRECLTGELGGRTIMLLEHLQIDPARIRDGFVHEKDINRIGDYLLNQLK